MPSRKLKLSALEALPTLETRTESEELKIIAPGPFPGSLVGSRRVWLARGHVTPWGKPRVRIERYDGALERWVQVNAYPAED